MTEKISTLGALLTGGRGRDIALINAGNSRLVGRSGDCRSSLRRRRIGRHDGVRCALVGGINQTGTTTPRMRVMTCTTRADQA
jgi:hypothetical protein